MARVTNTVIVNTATRVRGTAINNSMDHGPLKWPPYSRSDDAQTLTEMGILNGSIV
jgi:hypothetical protein